MPPDVAIGPKTFRPKKELPPSSAPTLLPFEAHLSHPILSVNKHPTVLDANIKNLPDEAPRPVTVKSTVNGSKLNQDIVFLEESCEPIAAQMLWATGGQWPAKRACLNRNPDRPCAVKFEGGPPDGFGSQIYKRMAMFQDAVQFSCAYVPSPLSTKKDEGSKLFRLVAHGVDPRDVDHTFGLTSSDPGHLTRTARSASRGLRRFCPSLKAKALVDPERGGHNVQAFRDNMAGAYCVNKAPLLRYTAAGFNRTLWLQGRAALRDLYVGSPGPDTAPPPPSDPKKKTMSSRPHHEAFLPTLGGTLGERHDRGEVAIVAHVRRGDVDGSHFRFVPLQVWIRAVASVVDATVDVLSRRAPERGAPPPPPSSSSSSSSSSVHNPNGLPVIPHAAVAVHIVTERRADAVEVSQWEAAVQPATERCGGCVRVATHGGDGQGPLADFSALVEADVLLVSDSAFALAAAQLTFGVVGRVGRAGFAERDVHWFLPLPLNWKDGEAIESGPNRKPLAEESAVSENALLSKSRARFLCRLQAYLKWRSEFRRADRWWHNKKVHFDAAPPVCGGRLNHGLNHRNKPRPKLSRTLRISWR